MKYYRIDHVVTMLLGEPCAPFHATMHLFANSAEDAFARCRKIDPRLSPGAEITESAFLPDSVTFNPAFHAFMMTFKDATHERIEADWEDTGDAENGPELTGHPAFDLYVLDGIEYIVDEHGRADRQPASPPFDTQGIECDAISRSAP